MNERVVMVSADAGSGAPSAANVLLARGAFEGVAHSARGTATRDPHPARPGADADRLRGRRTARTCASIWSPARARSEAEVDEFEDLGALKGNKGNQQYDLPRRVDLDRPHTVVIWCRAFSVNFARAPLS